MKITNLIKTFTRDEDGAVTVDWVVLTAAIVGLGIAVLSSVSGGTTSLADKISARSFPMPLPVIASSAEEREMLQAQAMVRPTLELAARADVTFVGIGELGQDAPLCVDGFVTSREMRELVEAGAVGEIVGWIFDAEGKLIEGKINDRAASARLPSCESSKIIASAMGSRKLPAIRAAVRGRLINGLITDERTAEALLK